MLLVSIFKARAVVSCGACLSACADWLLCCADTVAAVLVPCVRRLCLAARSPPLTDS